MYGIAIEKWDISKHNLVINWFKDHYGEQNKSIWYIDHDYDLITLCMNPELFIVYNLTFYEI